MKTTRSITIDVDVFEDLQNDVGKGNVSSWIEEQAKKNHESLEMEKKVIPRAEGNVLYTNNPNKPLLLRGATNTTLDIFTDQVFDIAKNIAGIDDLTVLKKVMKNSKVAYDVSKTRIRKLA